MDEVISKSLKFLRPSFARQEDLQKVDVTTAFPINARLYLPMAASHAWYSGAICRVIPSLSTWYAPTKPEMYLLRSRIGPKKGNTHY